MSLWLWVDKPLVAVGSVKGSCGSGAATDCVQVNGYWWVCRSVCSREETIAARPVSVAEEEGARASGQAEDRAGLLACLLRAGGRMVGGGLIQWWK